MQIRNSLTAMIAGLLLAAPLVTFAQDEKKDDAPKTEQGGGGRGGPGGGRGGPGGGGGRGGRGGGGGVVGLLMMNEVQEELGVNEEQKDGLRKVMEAMPRPDFAAFQGLESLSEEERTKRMDEFRKQSEETAKKAEEAIKGVLDELQMTRLGELRCQREGVQAFGRAEVAEQLKFTDEQKEKIKPLVEALRPTFGRGGPGGGGPGGGGGPDFRSMSDEERQAYRDEQTKKREQAQADVLAVLTDDQKSAWEKLQGEKFTFPERGGFGGFGGPGGGGRPGGRPGRPAAE